MKERAAPVFYTRVGTCCQGLSFVAVNLFEEHETDYDIEQRKAQEDPPVLENVLCRESIAVFLQLGSGHLTYLVVDFINGEHPLNPGDKALRIFVVHGIQRGQEHG